MPPPKYGHWVKTWKEIKFVSILTWKTIRFLGRIYTPELVGQPLNLHRHWRCYKISFLKFPRRGRICSSILLILWPYVTAVKEVQSANIRNNFVLVYSAVDHKQSSSGTLDPGPGWVCLSLYHFYFWRMKISCVLGAWIMSGSTFQIYLYRTSLWIM